MSGRRSRQPTSTGFSLIELLLVIAIIALLLALLAPGLAEARESSRRAVCLSNVRQIGVAHMDYFSDNRESAPFIPLGSGAAAFVYGGKTTSSYWYEPFYLTIREKPLNKYIYPQQVAADPGRVADDARIDLPAFRCPSDRQSYQRSRRDTATLVSAYDDVGTSYMFNMTYYPSQLGPGYGQRKVDALQRFIRRMYYTKSDRFVAYLEDSASMGLWNGVPTIGDHGALGVHTTVMLDGHGVHQYMDTTWPIGSNWLAVDDGARPFGS
ncbi:MAG: DUF1559 domain-containing protein [Phycisphaerales bacterium]